MEPRRAIALLAPCWIACVEPRAVEPSFAPSPVAPEASREPSAQRELEGPAQVSWTTLALDAHRAVLRARVRRSPRLALPLALTLTVPRGVRVEHGEVAATLPPAAQRPDLELDYVLSFEGVPADDAVLAVDGESAAMGVHARAVYRFGRPEPLGTRPVANGPAITFGGSNLGPSVMVPRPAPGGAGGGPTGP